VSSADIEKSILWLTPPSDDGPGVANNVGSDGVVNGGVGVEGVDWDGSPDCNVLEALLGTAVGMLHGTILV
jgi:hypothetical protein